MKLRMITFLPAIPVLIAVTVLTGWASGDDDLTRLWLASVSMNPTTALCFLALCVAIPLRRTRYWLCQSIAVTMMAAVVLVGALKLIAIVAHLHIGGDTILFASHLGLGGPHPNRMAPNTAFCFILIAVSLLIKRYRSERFAIGSQILALVTSVIALFAVVGYLYGVGVFYNVSEFIPMALHTAVAFLSLALFVFLQTSERGLIPPILDPGPAGRTSRMLLPTAVAVPVTFGYFRQLGEQAGWYSSEIGIALMVMMNVLALLVMIWWHADQQLKADTRRLAAEAELARMAAHDYLTGLPNRAQFMERLMSRMAGRRLRSDPSFAIIYMDLDGFKQVNDRLGHGSGDRLLQEVGRFLRLYARRQDDLVARLGGDEFAMLLDRIGSEEEVTAIAERIVMDMPPNFGQAGQLVPIGISVGIVIAEARHDTAEAILNDADAALYQAKRSGKGRYSVFAGLEESI